jgi:nucleoside phosphorylase
MKTLIITATHPEAERITKILNLAPTGTFMFSNKELETDLLITGIGIPATIFSMFANVNCGIYDLIINAGIAGSFNTDFNTGDVLNITSDSFADIVINGENDAKPVFETIYNENFRNLINNGRIYNTSDFPAQFRNLPNATAITVNIPERISNCNFDTESMEGAAFMLVCKHFKKNFIQIRGISNIIGKTERKAWNFKDPINNYSNIISEFITLTNKR